jgi:hypothetical protein
VEQEIRYRGQLLGFHPSRAAAEEHARKHHGWGRAPETSRADHEIEDIDNLTIEPRRPVSLLCRGALCDTFHTREDAAAHRDKAHASMLSSRLPPGLRYELAQEKIEDVWTIEGAA